MKKILSIIFVLLTTIATAQIHVTPTGAGTNSGENWANATTLESATVANAPSGTAIWVQAGTYNLSATLLVPQGVRLYGGFAGTEALLSQRNFATNRTILDANNNFAVVTLEMLAVLNGVTVQNGVANTPDRMNGGGVLMRAASRIEHSHIINNTALNRGGGVYAVANAEISNSVIADNRAIVAGFAVSGAQVTLRNNTVVGNTVLDCTIYASETVHDTVCFGESTVLSTSTAGTYLWNTGATTSSITTSPLTANTIFTVAISTATFCVVVDTFAIAVTPTPTVTVDVNPATANPAQMVTFTATANPPGGDFLWNDFLATTTSDLTVQMPMAGDLQFTVNYTVNGCAAEPVMATAVNSDFMPPVIDGAVLTADDLSVCLGDSTQIHLHGGVRNSGEWVLFSGACGGTEVGRSSANNPSFWVHPTGPTTFFLRGEGGGTSTTCIQITISALLPPMATVAPQTSLCVGENLTLNNLTAGGGTWTIGLAGGLSFVSETANAAVVTGTVAGPTSVVFTAANGCQAIFNLDVLAAPTAITGDTNFCQGQYRLLTSTPFGGTWTTAGGASATVTAAGQVNASATLTGNTVIRYTHPATGCWVQRTVVVHQQPARPSASASTVCIGDAITLNPGNPAGGTWSITPAGLANFNAGFTEITGLAVGTAVVRYQLNEFCSDTFHVSVLASPTGLSYANTLCQGNTSPATGFPAGGTWTTNAPTVATVDPATGVFTGVLAGTFQLIYTLPNGCPTTSSSITVHPTPETITGNASVGVGFTTQLTSTPGGTWQSLNPAIATVDGTGLVTGIALGTTTIRYTLPVGNCHKDHAITVYACASIALAPGSAAANQEVCLNALILNIVYVLQNATQSEISWLPTAPTGINFNTATHTISGTPTVSGVFTYTITSVNHPLGCPPVSVSGTLTVFDAVLPGAITSTAGTSFTICAGEIPVEFTSTAPATGGNPAGAAYQWQVSSNNVDFSNLAGATAQNFQASALATTNYFRRNHINTCGNAASNTIAVTAHPIPPTPTTETITPNTDCSGANPNGAITIANVAGMQFSMDGVTFGASRTFPNLAHGTHTIFLRNANNCVSSTTVYVPSESGAPELVGDMLVTPGATLCNPHAGGNIVLAPSFINQGTSPTFQWAVTSGTMPANNGLNTQNLTLTTAPTGNTTFRITVTNTQNTCVSHFYQTITVVTQPTITTQPVGGAICVGQAAFNLSALATSTVPHTYQWQRSTNELTGFENIVGQTSSSLTVASNAPSSYWYRLQVLRLNDVCPTVSSNAVQVLVHPVPSIASVTGGEGCGTGAVALSATANPSTANIRWFANQTGGVPITTGTPNDGITASGANWTTPSIATPTTFWAEAHNDACGSTSRASVVANVQPVHVITHTGGALNQNECQGIAITGMGFGFSGGASGGTIAWAGPDGGTSAPAGLTATATGISGTVAAGATPGTYTFTITTTSLSAICPTVSTSGSIVVHATPEPVTVTATPGCGSTVLNATGGDGGTIFWQGTTSEGRSIASPSTWQNITANGTYFFNAQSAQGCWSQQGSSTVLIYQPHTLSLTSAVGTNNQTVCATVAITPITYSRGGGATTVTVTWTDASNNPIAQPAWVNVSSLTATPITITATAPAGTAPGIFNFTIATVVTNVHCTSLSLTGSITIPETDLGTSVGQGCNSNVPGWGCWLGTITWGNTSNTSIESGTSTVSREGSVPAAVTTNPAAANNTQTWSGVVFATACAKGNATNNNEFNGGVSGSFNADCRQTLHTFNVGRAAAITGDFFSWCAVRRFADQLCPPPWRVPTTDDFRVLHWILRNQNPPAPGNNITHGNAGQYMATTGGNASPNIGGLWGGVRFSGSPGALTTASSRYWSSTEVSATNARSLVFDVSHVRPQTSDSKALGVLLRCVRNP